MTEKPLINKVAQKAIIQIDPVSFLPKATDIVAFDMKDLLFKGLLLKEKEFRAQLKEIDFSSYQDKYVYIHCSTDAIIPLWAHMLLTSYLNPYTKEIVYATSLSTAEELFLLKKIEVLDLEVYTNKRIVIKGCGEKNFSPLVYVNIMRILQPVAKAVSFGEACSMVPVFKA